MAIEIGALRALLSLDSAAFESGVRRAQAGMSNLQRGLQKTSERMGRIGRDLSTRVTLPIVGMGAGALKLAGDFEASMNRVQALSSATGDEFDALRNQAKELGATTQFSASQAADAMGFLAMAGFDAEQIIGSMPSTLQLAAASGMDLASAADIVSNILTGFGKDIEDLAGINDVLVKTMTSANVDLRMLGDAMKYVAPIASAAGMDFNEVAAALGLLGNAGIQGEMGGTALRGALSALANPTKQAAAEMSRLGIEATNADGSLKTITEIVAQLEPHLEDTGAMMTIFGQRAGPAMSALAAQGADALRELTGELNNAGGTAQRIADAQMQGLNGEMKNLRSAVEGLAIAFADAGLLEAVTAIVTKITDFVRGLSELDPQLVKFGTIAAVAVAALGPLAIGVGMAAAGFAALVSPVGLIVAGLSALAAGAAYVAMNWDDLSTRFPILQSGLEYIKSTAQIVGALFRGEFSEAFTLWKEQALRMMDGVKAALGDLPQRAIEVVTELGAALIEGIKALAGRVIEAARNLGGDLIQGLKDGISARIDSVKQSIASAADSVVGIFRDKTETRSPSRVFMRLGNDLMDGLTIGIAERAPAAANAAGQAAAGVTAAMETMKDSPAVTSLKDGIKSISDLFADSLFDGKNFFQGIADMARQAAKRLFSSGLEQILNRILGLTQGAFGGGGGGGFFGSLLGGLFGGFRADGGPVAAGRAYMVGERGPEMIVPKMPGTVIPNEMLRSRMPANAPAAPSVDVRQKIVNVLDPSIVGDFLATAQGEELIVNVVRKYA